MRLLVIEDNPKMAAFIAQGLSEQGYAVDVAETGEEGEQLAAGVREGILAPAKILAPAMAEGERLAAGETYDAILLDLMLPDVDGVQICRNLRRRGVKTPILVITALSTTADKVTGLDAGADDYLTKPFEFDELVARVRALLRRGQAHEAATLRFDDLEMDLASRQVTRGGQRLSLTAKEFALLEYLLRNPGRVLTRTAISEHVWDMNFESDSNVIDVYISMLRRKIDKGFDKRLIHTVIGAGYMLSAEEPGA